MAADRHVGFQESLHRRADVGKVQEKRVMTIYGVQLVVRHVVVACKQIT